MSCFRQGVAHVSFSSGAGDSGPVLLPRSVPHDQGVGGEVQGGRLQRVDLHQGRCSSPSLSVNCATSVLKRGFIPQKCHFCQYDVGFGSEATSTQDRGVVWMSLTHKYTKPFQIYCISGNLAQSTEACDAYDNCKEPCSVGVRHHTL